MVRDANSTDLPALRRVAEGTAMFIGEELDSFVTEMNAHLERAALGQQPATTLIVATEGSDDDAPIVGAAYFAPEVMAQGVMNLLFIGVLPEARGKGHGRALLDRFEGFLRAAGARLAIIETASDEMFGPAWRLYRQAGYEQEARIRDFYDDGIDKLVFRKRL